MKIITNYSSPNYSNRPNGIDSVSSILLHTTEGAFPGDLEWLCSSASGVSCHYVISPTGDVYSIVPDSKCAWHAGAGNWLGCTDLNDISIGIECSHVMGSPWPPALMASLDGLCRQLIGQYAIVKDWVTAHRWYATPPGRKIDPTDFPDSELFMFIDGLYAPAPPVTIDTYERRYRVRYNRSCVRQGPGTAYPLVGYVDSGREFMADSASYGESVEGNDLWQHAASGVGFISDTAVERVA